MHFRVYLSDMNTRGYVMRARADAVEETRRRILTAVWQLGLEAASMEIVLGDVADRAGVTVRTVLRHFGSKDGLFAATQDFVSAELLEERGVPAPGDTRAAVTAVFDEYEDVGDWVITMLGQENTVPDVRRMTDRGRALHREWVRAVFGPRLPADGSGDEVLDLLVVATDVYTWKLLRRDRGLDRDAAERRVDALVRAVLADPTREG
jgi:AcrR family transcriptional regulator